jgi:hypothetical protein
LLRLLGAGLPNNLVNLTRVQCTRAVSLRFLTEEPQYLGLRHGQLDIITNAKKHSSGDPTLLDNKRSPLVIYSAQ